MLIAIENSILVGKINKTRIVKNIGRFKIQDLLMTCDEKVTCTEQVIGFGFWFLLKFKPLCRFLLIVIAKSSFTLN